MNTVKKRSLAALVVVISLLLPAIRTYGFDYSNPYQEGSRNYEFTLKDTNSEKVNSLYFSDGLDVPASFSLRDKIDLVVSDQSCYGLCALFAITKSLETNYALTYGEYIDLSERYTSYMDSIYLYSDRDPGKEYESMGDGFDYYLAPLYFGLFGVPSEEQVPLTDLSEEEILKLKNIKTLVRCTSTVVFPDMDNLTNDENAYWSKVIKKHVMKYGSVTTSISSPSGENYNYDTNACYYREGMVGEGGHAVSIVGWDDNYPKENFTSVPERDGAYLCLNSWGEEWGQDGYFWLSYEDQSCLQYLGIISSEKIDETSETTIYTNAEKINCNSGCEPYGEPFYGIRFEKEEAEEYLYQIVLGVLNVPAYGESGINENEGGALHVFINPKDDSFDKDKLVLLCTIEGNTVDNYTVLLEKPYPISGDHFSIVLEFVTENNHPTFLSNLNSRGEELENVIFTASNLDSEWYPSDYNFPIFVMTGPEHLSSAKPVVTPAPESIATPTPTTVAVQTPQPEENASGEMLNIALGGLLAMMILLVIAFLLKKPKNS